MSSNLEALLPLDQTSHPESVAVSRHRRATEPRPLPRPADPGSLHIIRDA